MLGRWRSRRRRSPPAPATPTRSCVGVFDGEQPRAQTRRPRSRALLATGEARSVVQVARAHARRRQALAARRPRQARATSRPSARASPRRPRATARASWRRARSAGSCPRDAGARRRRARSSRARCSPTTASSATSPRRADDADAPPKRLERLIVAAPARARRDASPTPALVAEAVNAARDLQNRPAQRPHADGARPRTPRRSRARSTACRSRSRAARASSRAAWAPSPPSRRAPSRSRR